MTSFGQTTGMQNATRKKYGFLLFWQTSRKSRCSFSFCLCIWKHDRKTTIECCRSFIKLPQFCTHTNTHWHLNKYKSNECWTFALRVDFRAATMPSFLSIHSSFFCFAISFYPLHSWLKSQTRTKTIFDEMWKLLKFEMAKMDLNHRFQLRPTGKEPMFIHSMANTNLDWKKGTEKTITQFQMKYKIMT